MNYQELLQHFPPKIIYNKEQLKATQEVSLRLRNYSDDTFLTKDEEDYLLLLQLLLEDALEDRKVSSINLNHYYNNDLYTPEEQINLFYEKLLPLKEEGFEFILSFGQDLLINPESYKADLDVNFLVEEKEFTNIWFNETIEERIETAYQSILKECKERNTETIVVFAYIYSESRILGYVNDVGIEVNFR